MWLHHVACVMRDVHTSVVVDVRAGMAAQVMAEYYGYAKDIPANTRIVEIGVSGRGMLHYYLCDLMTANGGPCLITPPCMHT